MAPISISKSKPIFSVFSRLTVCRILNAYAHSYHKSELEHAFGSMVDSQKLLNLPLDNEESIEQGTLIPRIDLSHIGSASILGRREYNEDRLLACQLSSHHLLLGVFDGHGGSAAAEFSRAMFPDCVQYELTSLRNWARRQGQSLRSADPRLFEPVMERAFLQVNNLMMRHFFHYGTEKCMPCFVHVSAMHDRQHFIWGRLHFILARERQWSGTTATVVLLRHSHQLIVGHVGDSRALICRGGRIDALTVNHDPNNLTPLRDLSPGEHGTGVTESERIATFGGTVITNSLGVPVVNGRLGMTRSLGDAELKAFGVTARPQISSIKVRHSNASFLTLVSDGVTYVMSDEEIQTIIAACRTPRDAAQSIVETAMLYGSDDNASALVIPFGYWGKYTPSSRRHGEPSQPRLTINSLQAALARD
ncbi:protein phosphatase 1K [Paragonimus westermani]|uniref:Protein phosphatase 1K n=1 Tax=Paragonimus westermani TaxID=34504 RepID=A0A5J4NCW0_9TREM|nr:protein phosphatase 1K [Paragonimus westermani]